MRIAILNANDKVLGFLDNTTSRGIHYWDSLLHLYLAGSAYTLNFKTMTQDDPDCLLQAGNKLSFKYRNRDFYLNIVKVIKDEWSIEVEAFGLSFELLNEEVDAYESPDAKSFVEYVNLWGAEMKVAPIILNEVADRKLKLKWDGRETILKRLFSLANNFDCELSFDAVLNPDHSLKHINLSIVKEVGEDRSSQVIRYGKDVRGLKKTVDISDIYTAIRPFGKEGMTLAGYSHAKESDGCYLLGSDLRSPNARDQFPAFNSDIGEGYILRYWDFDTDSKDVLYGEALSELRKNSKPKVSYDIEGYVDVGIGDWVTIEDDNFNPKMFIKCRVIEQQISLDDETKNKTTFDNFTELSSQISDETAKRIQVLIDQAKRYTGEIISTGTILKKDMSTILTAKVLDGAKEIDEPIKWYKGDTFVSDEKSITVQWNDFEKSQKYHFEGEKVYAEVTVTTVYDGEKGDPGSKGDKGDPGSKGEKGDPGSTGPAGQDTISLSVAYTTGSNASITLTISVFKGSTLQTDTQVAELGMIKWYKGTEVLGTGKSLTRTITGPEDITVKLENGTKVLALTSFVLDYNSTDAKVIITNEIQTWVQSNYMIGDTVNELFSSFKQDYDSITTSISERVTTVNDKLTKEVTERSKYTRLDSSGLWIGDTSKPIQLLMDADKIRFVVSGDKDNPPMWITAYVIHIRKLEVVEEAQICGLMFKKLTGTKWEVTT